jgi:shikimate dehydrogenase
MKYLYALLGKTLSHSLSPFIHEQLFNISKKSKKNPHNGDYILIEKNSLENLTIPKLIQECKCFGELKGFNITIPYKREITPILDKTFKKMPVNCVKIYTDPDELDFMPHGVFLACGTPETPVAVGFNTDYLGFRESCEKERLGGRVLLLGFGGAGEMVANEVLKAGGDLTVVCRKGGKSYVELGNYVLEKGKKFKSAVVIKDETYVQNPQFSDVYDIMVNSTPVGMYPKMGEWFACREVFDNVGYFYDLIYNPAVTEHMKFAKQAGIPAVNGLKMLVLQAAYSHYIWYGGIFSAGQVDRIVKMCAEKMSNEQ